MDFGFHFNFGSLKRSSRPSIILELEFDDFSNEEDFFNVYVDGVLTETLPENTPTAPSTVIFEIRVPDFNTEYEIEIKAVEGVTESTALGPFMVYSPPRYGPTGLAAVPTAPEAIALTWTLASETPASGGQKVYHSAAGGPFVLLATLADNVTSYDAGGLLDDTSHAFYVTAYNENGTQKDAESPVSNTATAITPVELTPPTIVSSSIDPTGLILTDNFSENVQIGTGGSGGRVLVTPAGNKTCTLTSVSGSQIIWAIPVPAVPILETGQSITSNYTQPTNGIEDTSGNHNDMVTVTGLAVTNGSLVNPPDSFAWDMETLNANTFTSDGTGTIVSTASLSTDVAHGGTKSLKISSGFATIDFATGAAVPNLDWNKDEGTIECWVYYSATTGSARIVNLECETSTHNVRLVVNTATHEATLSTTGGSTVGVTVTGLTVNNWHKLTAKWRNSGALPTLSLQRDAAAAVTTNTALPTMTGIARYMRFGNYQSGFPSGGGAALYIDDVAINRIWKV